MRAGVNSIHQGDSFKVVSPVIGVFTAGALEGAAAPVVLFCAPTPKVARQQKTKTIAFFITPLS